MNKTLSAILSFAPLVLLIIACAGLFITSFALGMDNELVGGALVAMILILICEIVAVIATFGMMIWYIIKTCKNPNFTSGEKVLWVILLYMLNVFVFPVYWFMFVKNEQGSLFSDATWLMMPPTAMNIHQHSRACFLHIC